MIKFFIRLGLFLVSLVLTIGLSAGIDVNSFVLVAMFLCVWVIVVPFENIFWWLFTYAILFSVLNYDNWGIYIVMLLGVVLVFDIIYAYLKRTANDSNFVLYITIFLLANLVSGIVNLIWYKIIFMDINSILLNIFITTCLFFVFKFMIKNTERFISLYTHGADMRCHT